MSLLKGIRIALLISTTSFSLLVIPLAKLSDEAVEIRVNHQTQFMGSLRHLAGPYLGAASVLSLSLGMAALGMSGWQASRREARHTQRSLQSIKTQLKNRELQLQTLQFSEQRLENSGLSEFLPPPNSPQPLLAAPSHHTQAPHHSARQTDPAPLEQATPPKTAHAFSVQAGYRIQPLRYEQNSTQPAIGPTKMYPVEPTVRQAFHQVVRPSVRQVVRQGI
jgi:type II secretory pathway pseudopilin PulG